MKAKQTNALEQLAEIQKRVSTIDKVLTGDLAYVEGTYPPHLVCAHMRKKGIDTSKMRIDIFSDSMIANFEVGENLICMMIEFKDHFNKFCLYYGGSVRD